MRLQQKEDKRKRLATAETIDNGKAVPETLNADFSCDRPFPTLRRCSISILINGTYRRFDSGRCCEYYQWVRF